MTDYSELRALLKMENPSEEAWVALQTAAPGLLDELERLRACELIAGKVQEMVARAKPHYDGSRGMRAGGPKISPSTYQELRRLLRDAPEIVSRYEGAEARHADELAQARALIERALPSLTCIPGIVSEDDEAKLADEMREFLK